MSYNSNIFLINLLFMKSKYLFIGLIIIFLFFLYYFYITHKKLKTATYELNTLKKYFNIEKIDNTTLVEGECAIKTNYLDKNIQIPSNTTSNTENNSQTTQNLALPQDQKMEEKKMTIFFDELHVNIRFDDLIIKPNYVFWSGTINGIIQFIKKHCFYN